MRHLRIAFAALTLSAAGFAGLALEEHFTSTAVIPTKGDRPTIGLGSTFRDDGTPVQMGDTITPPQAIKRSVNHIAKDEAGLKRCVTGAMSQTEYDTLVKFAYQYGVTATCNSSMVRNTNAGQYAQACEGYTLYRYSAGFDCSTPGNRVCAGVWTRNLERRDACRAAQ